jgi:DNA-binding response OmpR family regulator
VSVETVVIARSGDRWLPRLLDALAEAVTRRPVVVHTLRDAELAIAARGADLIVFDPAVTGADLPLVAGARADYRFAGWLGSRSSPVVAALLDAGADEVLDASMGEEEIVARLRRCIARVVTQPEAGVVIGGLMVNARLRTAEWAGRPLALTARETEVLQVLAAAHPRPVRREVVYRLVWGWAMPRGDRTVDVNVKRLRDKLLRAGALAEIRTHPGVGYGLDVQPATEVVTGL